MQFHNVIVCAPVAQGIEHRPPEAGAPVRLWLETWKGKALRCLLLKLSLLCDMFQEAYLSQKKVQVDPGRRIVEGIKELC